MDDKTRELIAIGAAYAGNCEACLGYHIREGAEVGLNEDEIRQAIRIAGSVKNSTTKRLDRMAERLLANVIAEPVY